MNVEDEIHQIHIDMKEMKLIQENQGLLIEKSSKETSKLNLTLIALNLTLAEANGKKEGMKTTIKIIWGTVGSSLIGAIIAGSVLIVQMNSQIAVLENKLDFITKRKSFE